MVFENHFIKMKEIWWLIVFRNQSVITGNVALSIIDNIIT